MATVYLALGSNVGDPEQNIEQAIGLLNTYVSGIKRAPVYRSKPVGHTDQADFLNTAVSGQTALNPGQLLESIKETEKKLGRIERFRWGPREIDIDIIFYDDLKMETDALTLPHPAFRDRDFVLRPLRDLNPNLIDPTTGQTVARLLGDLPRDKYSIKD